MPDRQVRGIVDDLFVDDIFRFNAENIDSWIIQSQYLKTASEKIYDDLFEANLVLEEDINQGRQTSENDVLLAGGLNQTWMLAVGFSVECLIKAIIISTATEPIITPDGKFNLKIFGNEKRTHDLYYLFKRKIENTHKPELVVLYFPLTERR